MIHEKPRVRFAPSPTGYLHVGGLRTALYNYLFAKKNNGVFVLRIEDTDRARYVEGAVDNLIDALKWAGLEYDEGPKKGGDYGPYIQSERINLYNKCAEELINQGKAYYCFCSAERLDALRKEQEKTGKQTKYDKLCLSLRKEEIEKKLKNGEKYVVRLNTPSSEIIAINDLIRGDVTFDSSVIDDQVLIKSDGFPTYHLANVVDDHYMKISHVIRGEEWLSSTPKHALLYDYFGWEKPKFAHLPLLLNPDKSKLSKRQGDVAVEDYRDKGFLKETLINFVALLGWNAGDDKEFYSINELIDSFSLERVNKSGAVFNIEKLKWLNAEHLRKKTDAELTEKLKDELRLSKYKNNNYSDDFLLKIIGAMRERVEFIKEFIEKCQYFYERPQSYDPEAIKKNWKEDSSVILTALIEEYENLQNPIKEDYEKGLAIAAERLNVGKGKIIHPLRLALTGVSGGPGMFDITEILGKDEVIFRIKKAIELIKIN